MTTDLVELRAELDLTADGVVASVIEFLAGTKSADQVLSVRAQVEQAKAWARVYKRTKEFRHVLLVLEVTALVRLWEINSGKGLSGGERAAAEWLAGMTGDERAALIEKFRTATTAAGLRNIYMWDLRDEKARANGREWARNPSGDPGDTTGPGSQDAWSLAENLLGLLEDEGDAFNIADMADALLCAAGRSETDPAFLDGVREVCRSAVRSAHQPMIDGTVIPRFITIPVDHNRYLRVPIGSVTIGQLDSSLAMKEQQLAALIAATGRFRKFVAKVHAAAVPDHPDVKVAGVIAKG